MKETLANCMREGRDNLTTVEMSAIKTGRGREVFVSAYDLGREKKGIE